MKTFGYWRDRLFLCACVLYAVNRWGIKPHTHVHFFQWWFNDLLLIPCALPLALWFQRRLGLRTHDRAPTPLEIVAHLAGWSLLFELIGPKLVAHATGDPWDVAAYAGGALVSLAVWQLGPSHEQHNEL